MKHGIVAVFMGALLLMGHGLRAEEGIRKFFEPSQADYDCCYKAIRAQQTAYFTAKNAKQWDLARSLALFHYVRAWLYNNQANAMISTKEGWNSIPKLNEALWLLAQGHAELEKEKGFKKYAGACWAKLEANRMAIEDQIQSLEKRSKK